MLEGVNFDEANRLREQNMPIADEPSGINASNRPVFPSRSSNAEMRMLQQKLREEPASFADFIRLTPYIKDGTPVGYQVSPGKDPSLFREVGLQDGDVVIELNGYDLSDTAQALEAVSLINNAQSLDFEVLRNDELISLNLDIPRN
jgi:general secretion pathway protein C